MSEHSWPWPDELDAAIAAPKHHAIVFENDRMRVLDTRIAPGEVVPVHTRRWPGVYYTLQFSPFVRRDGEGNVLLDTRTLAAPLPNSAWLENLPPHSVENVGEVEVHLVSVELKR